MIIKNILRSLVLFCIITISACTNTELPQDQIPFVPFNNIEINLSNIQYISLRNNGGWVELNTGGVRGIILYRNSPSEYIAYERNCSYEPNEACATVNVDPSGLFMVDNCCGSTFNFADGNPLGGPAIFPLRRYRVILDGNFLTITDEPLN
ncbi:MAG: hypothetical protein AAFX87_11940 [Bacteroidota bacterium]